MSVLQPAPDAPQDAGGQALYHFLRESDGLETGSHRILFLAHQTKPSLPFVWGNSSYFKPGEGENPFKDPEPDAKSLA